ncbi:MAG: hypothetical protein MJ077_11150, partial [Oscillospiraceae bacterium]|nr:hypothetical protein [Oscillospiraceae bacterium]
MKADLNEHRQSIKDSAHHIRDQTEAGGVSKQRQKLTRKFAEMQSKVHETEKKTVQTEKKKPSRLTFDKDEITAPVKAGTNAVLLTGAAVV